MLSLRKRLFFEIYPFHFKLIAFETKQYFSSSFEWAVDSFVLLFDLISVFFCIIFSKFKGKTNFRITNNYK